MPVFTVGLVIVGEEIVGVVIDGEVSVLFVSVSVVAFPTRVSVVVGSVSVPEATADA